MATGNCTWFVCGQTFMFELEKNLGEKLEISFVVLILAHIIRNLNPHR